MEQTAQIAMREIYSFLQETRPAQEVTAVCFDGLTKAAYGKALQRACV